VRGVQVKAARMRIVHLAQIPQILHHHPASKWNRFEDRSGVRRAQGHCLDYEVSEASKREGGAGKVERRGVVIDGPGVIPAI